MKFIESDEPIAITFTGWSPKCNTEKEKRMRMDFELPLIDSVLALLPAPIQNAAAALADAEGGVTELKISNEFMHKLEVHTLPSSASKLSFAPSLLQGLILFRPTSKDGKPTERFLKFNTTVLVPANEAAKIAGWAFENMTESVFINFLDVQQELPLNSEA